MTRYFSFHYLAHKSGSLIGQLIFPVISRDFKCFGDDRCYPISFMISTSVLITSFVVFVTAKNLFSKVDKSDNVFLRSCTCIISAIYHKLFGVSNNTKNHWLDYSEKSHNKQIISDVKVTLKVSKILLTLPLFWAMYNQGSSRFVFQANRMNGDLGFYTLKPDQMVMTTTIFCILSVPLTNKILFPILEKLGFDGNIYKITIGMCSGLVAFIIASIVEYSLVNNLISSMMWLIPQYFFIAMGDVLVWIPMLNLLFAKCPESMKSVVSSFLYLTTAGGNMIIIFVSGLKLIKSQFVEFISYAILLIFDIIIFILMGKSLK